MNQRSAGRRHPTRRETSRYTGGLFRRETTPEDFFVNSSFMGPTIMTHASEEVKDRFLPKMLRGEEVWCQLFSEPAAGSDLAGIRTRAEKDGDEWVVNGQKVWTSYAQHADWAVLVARHDTTLPKHQGLTYFLLDMTTPGVEVVPIKQISGASHFNEVFLSDVRVPDSLRLGEVGAGWSVAMTTLMNERFSTGRDLRPDVEELMRLVQEVEIDGRPAIENSAVRERVVDLYVSFQAHFPRVPVSFSPNLRRRFEQDRDSLLTTESLPCMGS